MHLTPKAWRLGMDVFLAAAYRRILRPYPSLGKQIQEPTAHHAVLSVSFPSILILGHEQKIDYARMWFETYNGDKWSA